MTNRVDTFLIPPLFYDVLGGEFQPQSDPDSRTHTLGRLACRTYEQGKLSPAERGGWESYRYTPSWASGVEATVHCDYLFDPNLHVMQQLAVHAASGKVLSVAAFANNGRMFAQVNGGESIPLELGEGLIEVRDEVAQLSQALFDTVEK